MYSQLSFYHKVIIIATMPPNMLAVCCSVQIGLTIMTRMFYKCRHCRFVQKLENF